MVSCEDLNWAAEVGASFDVMVCFGLVSRKLRSAISQIVHPQLAVESFAIGAMLTFDLAVVPRGSDTNPFVQDVHVFQGLLKQSLMLCLDCKECIGELAAIGCMLPGVPVRAAACIAQAFYCSIVALQPLVCRLFSGLPCTGEPFPYRRGCNLLPLFCTSTVPSANVLALDRLIAIGAGDGSVLRLCKIRQIAFPGRDAAIVLTQPLGRVISRCRGSARHMD